MFSAEQRGSIYAILSGFLYGFIGYFGMSVINESLSVTNMLFWRFLISTIVMSFALLGQIKKINCTLKDARIAFMNGALFYGLSTIIYFYACPYIGSGLAMVIFFTYPAIIMLLNHFLYRQHVPTLYYYAIFIIIAGMTFFVDTNEVEFDVVGIVLSVVSAVFYAAYIISSKKIATLSANVSTLMVCFGCMVTSFIASIINHTLVVPTTNTMWFNLFGISIISTVIPILLLLSSLNYIRPEKTSILSVLEPIFVFIFGITLLGEPAKLHYFIGVVIVLSGAIITLKSPQSKRSEASPNSPSLRSG